VNDEIIIYMSKDMLSLFLIINFTTVMPAT